MEGELTWNAVIGWGCTRGVNAPDWREGVTWRRQRPDATLTEKFSVRTDKATSKREALKTSKLVVDNYL